MEPSPSAPPPPARTSVSTSMVPEEQGVEEMTLTVKWSDLHEFLSAVYAEYDIMIWSATRVWELYAEANTKKREA
ncbi:hypothetical protein J5N97_001734 [Dioscorea zingiberensis]|uniref:FCP1 homology domain-containing protein n=1 Tax=Dioscorea zingiberensis TaxID=325984 RepID=A0A9D5H251_9LILI|nr:hypothetical protein J5N97_001734 [Dioscorea zingiberensis]